MLLRMEALHLASLRDSLFSVRCFWLGCLGISSFWPICQFARILDVVERDQIVVRNL